MTRTVAGSTRTTPSLAGGATRTSRSYCPGRISVTSTKASKSAADTPLRSRGTRAKTVTCRGVTCVGRVAFRTWTATPLTVTSDGAAAMLTATRATTGCGRRTVGSGDPTVTRSTNDAVAPCTDTGSVIASVTVSTALSGPITSTIAGAALTAPTTKPAAGSPSTIGRTGTIFLLVCSKDIEIVDGVTCTTSTPNGARMSSSVSWKS